MDTPVEILVAVFKDQSRATAMVNTLKQMNKSGAVKLVDAAVISHDDKGKTKIDEVEELTTGKGAGRGAVVGGVLGLVFPPSFLASTAVGAAIGGLWGKIRDTGIKTDELKTVADELQPGEIAVIALVQDVWVQQFLAAAQGYDRLFRQALDAEAAGVLAADPVTGEAFAVAFEKTGDAGTSAPAASTTTASTTDAAATAAPTPPPAASAPADSSASSATPPPASASATPSSSPETGTGSQGASS
ncbi:MAG TPA: DUF1269 domain-containing protein [Thermomicrobiales bacterium]|jgi:uncharacterized membrane protein